MFVEVTHTNLLHSLKTHIHFLDKTEGRVPAQSFLHKSFVCVGAFIQRARWRTKAISKQSLLLAESEAINFFSTLFYREQHKELQQMELQRGHLEGKHLTEGGGLKGEELTHNQRQYLTHFDFSWWTYSAELIYMPPFCTSFHWLLCLFVEYNFWDLFD